MPTIKLTLEKGSLPNYHIKDPVKHRRNVLSKLIVKETATFAQVVRRLNVLAIFNKNKHPEYTLAVRRDILFLQKLFRKKSTSRKRSSRKRSYKKRTSRKRSSRKRSYKKRTSRKRSSRKRSSRKRSSKKRISRKRTSRKRTRVKSPKRTNKHSVPRKR